VNRGTKKSMATIFAAVSLVGTSAWAAGVQQIDPEAHVSVGGATSAEGAGRVRVDATAGASVMITPDQNYEPASYPLHDGKRVPDNLSPVPPATEAPATARVVIRGQRTDFGLNTNSSKTGTAVGANVKAKGSYAAAFGNGADVKAEEGLALGHGAVVRGSGSVALGAGSTATDADVISVGNENLVRKVTNIADGAVAAGSHDAVTGNQLYITDRRVQELAQQVMALQQENGALKKMIAELTSKGQ